MRDFDIERDKRSARPEDERTFKIGGELFVMRASVKPDAIKIFDELTGDTGLGRTFEIIDEVILAMIETEGHDRYRVLRLREEDPITNIDLKDLVEWLMSEQTGRTPTQPVLASVPGPTHTGTTLTEDSSARAAEA